MADKTIQIANSPSDEKENYMPGRYFAYLARFRTLVRYLAYTSDVGEAFRPIVNPKIVTAAYAISWGYVLGDVSYEGYKAYNKGKNNTEISRTVIERALFQSIASMALPAFTIHTQVRFGKVFFKKLGIFTKWGPTVSGFALIPLLPYLFDHPVEIGIEKLFATIWPIEKKDDDKHEKKH